MEGFKMTPLDALFSFLKKANPATASKLKPEFYTISALQNLGTANPNTKVTLVGDNVNIVGTKIVAYNRLNIKKVFNVFGSVMKRPVVKIHKNDNTTTTVTVAQLIAQINQTLGIDFDTVSTYKDFTGTTSFTLPSNGNYIDVDIPVDGSTLALRLIPDAANPLQVRILVSGVVLIGALTDHFIHPFIGSTPYIQLNNAGLLSISSPKKTVQFVVYNKDFTSVFDGLNHATETGHYTITGAAVTRFNAAMAALGIGVTCAGPLKLSTKQYPHNLYVSTPDPQAGGNPRFTSNVIIDSSCLTVDSNHSVLGDLRLPINPTAWAEVPQIDQSIADVDCTDILKYYATNHAPAGYPDILTLVNTGGMDDTTQWWTITASVLTAINAKLTAAGLPTLPDNVRVLNRFTPAVSDATLAWSLLCKDVSGFTVPSRSSWAAKALRLDTVANPLGGSTTNNVCLYFNAS